MPAARIAAALCATALFWPVLTAAGPRLEIEPGPSCGQVDERFLGRIPVEIVIDEKALERHRQDEYIVLGNDGSRYEEPVFLDPSEVAPIPPLR